MESFQYDFGNTSPFKLLDANKLWEHLRKEFSERIVVLDGGMGT